jgi:putative pyruvate formate lyase activating enzyme
MKIDANDIASRAAAARQSLSSCDFCARHCAVNRLVGDTGFCGLDAQVCCFREMLHDAEETALNPSHQIYFSGCNLRCEFCSVLEWVQDPQAASPLDVSQLLQAITLRRSQGAKTLNLLGGEPAVSVHGILELLARIDPDTQVVWNSNMYYSDLCAQWLDGIVDVFLADLKCANPVCSERLLGAADYCDVARTNVQVAAGQGDVIIRHLLMPGHWDCCFIPTLEWIADHVPFVPVSLRMDYIPPAQGQFAPLTYTCQAERQAALDLLEQYNLRGIT